MAITFITSSHNKYNEIQSIIPSITMEKVDLDEIQEIDPHKIIQAKLKQAGEMGIRPCIVEDTSLYFEGLNGLPGPLIKWFLQVLGNDGLYSLSKKIGNSQVVAKTIIGYRGVNSEVLFFEGDMIGDIVEPRGKNGFGWNPIFRPQGEIKTFAEMTDEEKEKYSMRKKAATKLNEFLLKNQML
jgi:non-canonical purine NTP pyrophosphatase (RdgB/HAM1 family)